ncbi:hypothetical protein CRE_23793, partial [Caenorhabditis remanei]
HADDRTDPPGFLESEDRGEHAGGECYDRGSRESFPRLVRADPRRHLVLAERHSRGVRADIDRDDDEHQCEHPPLAPVGHEQQHAERTEERDVDEGEQPREDVSDERLRRGLPLREEPLDQPPDGEQDRTREQAEHHAGGTEEVGAPDHDEPAEHDPDARHPAARGAERGREFNERDRDDRGDEQREEVLPDEQAHQEERAEGDARTDREEQVASRTGFDLGVGGFELCAKLLAPLGARHLD